MFQATEECQHIEGTVMKKKELQELIKQGEGYFVEFKKQVGEFWGQDTY